MSRATARISKPLFAVLALALAVALAALSSFVQREGPELEAYGNLCGPAADKACYKPVLKAGLPFAYLFDQPGVSVERKLGFGEDRLEPLPLVLDVGIFWVAITLAYGRFHARRPGCEHGTA